LAPALAGVLGFSVRGQAALVVHLRKGSVAVAVVLGEEMEAANALVLATLAYTVVVVLSGDIVQLALTQIVVQAGLFVLFGLVQVQAVWPVLSHPQIQGTYK
jgi:hypothetical protein